MNKHGLTSSQKKSSNTNRKPLQFHILQFFTMVCLAGLLLSGCASNRDDKLSYDQITQEEAKTLMDSEPDAVILDVRTEEEYSDCHITGAICIPNETIDESVLEQLPDKEQLILVYCRSGNRSKQASEKLADLGYTNIKEFGGINTWQYEVE